MSDHSSLLITGVSGRVSSAAVRHIVSKQLNATLSGITRTPLKATDILPKGISIRKADFDDPERLPQSFRSAERVLFVSTPSTSLQGQRLTQHRAAVAAMAAAKVRHVVYTSMQGADQPFLDTVVSDHRDTEALIKTSGMTYTFVRDAFYMDLILAMLPTAVRTGCWVTAAREGRIAYVDWADCARTAAECLVRPDLDGRIYNATGAAALSVREVVALANKVLGTSIRVEDADHSEMREYLVSSGMHPQMAAVLSMIDVGIAQGAMSTVADDVLKVTGRMPLTVEQFLIDHRSSVFAQARSV